MARRSRLPQGTAFSRDMALCIGTVVLIAPDHEALIAGIILMLVFLTNAASSLRIVFQLRVRNSLTIAVLTVQGILWGGVVVWGYLSGSGMVFLALGFTLTTALASLMQGALALRDARVTFRGIKSQCFELIRLGAPIAIGGLLVMGYGRIDQVLVFKLVGSKDAGLYVAAYRIYSQASFAPVSISTTFFALLTAAFIASRSRFRALYQTSLELLLAVSIGGLAIAITYASAITTLLYGKGFAPAAPALPILMGAFVLVCVGYLHSGSARHHHRPAEAFCRNSCACRGAERGAQHRSASALRLHRGGMGDAGDRSLRVHAPLVAPALVISKSVDAIVVVARRSSLRRKYVNEASRLLGACPVSTLGYVLVDTEVESSAYYRYNGSEQRPPSRQRVR